MAARGVVVATGLALLGAVAPAASAAEVYAGAGPRWRGGELEAVGTTHAAVDMGRFVDLTLDVSGYLGGVEEGVTFAGASGGVMVRAPIPGPVAVESGLTAGVMKRTLARHGHDDLLPVVSWESAVLGRLGPARLRLAYSRALGLPGGAPERDLGSQLVMMVGFGL